MKTKIKLPVDNEENELPIKISMLFIFFQMYDKTKSIQMAVAELLDIANGCTKNAIFYRDKYEVDGDFNWVACATDYLFDTYDVEERLEHGEAMHILTKIKESMPQEDIPIDFKVGEEYHIDKDEVYISLGAMLIANSFQSFYETALEPMQETVPNLFFEDIKSFADSKGLDAENLQIDFEKREFSMGVEGKDEKAARLLEELKSIIDE